ncbi:hypothetical protein PF005_g28468 [Phytophthora fragariae]|uniref:Uncharacterized protein n=1 Tax=Phytophthora fragariae TaxID=53985 RepID=A0A6A3QI21_9STRA|nr:hypothetical protein PF003_g12409 [Phytophthora fragariae]KAE8920727.1 hypothetical protein PF009_g28982 [Phytophthora fragariae]KAE9068032.1 hypothetical protein PF007_g27840 [Phytophthora fragariae]KAE9076652.1 hypothetical protein PF006_g28081 [Phytophthora fragariae]KAE9168232.1 hypothetical protein PF005_g28468 [Phytophthora fragariae]
MRNWIPLCTTTQFCYSAAATCTVPLQAAGMQCSSTACKRSNRLPRRPPFTTRACRASLRPTPLASSLCVLTASAARPSARRILNTAVWSSPTRYSITASSVGSVESNSTSMSSSSGSRASGQRGVGCVPLRAVTALQSCTVQANDVSIAAGKRTRVERASRYHVDTCINTSKNCMIARALATKKHLAQTKAITIRGARSAGELNMQRVHRSLVPSCSVACADVTRHSPPRLLRDWRGPYSASGERVLRGHVRAGACRRARFLPNEWF